jgi:uncharacterized membrane protein
MDPKDITPGALDTWGKLAPKSLRTWMLKLALTVACLVAPWFLIQWRYALLYVLLIWAIENSIRDAIPVIVALAKQELPATSGRVDSAAR